MPWLRSATLRQVVVDVAVALTVYMVAVCIAALTRPRIDWSDHVSRVSQGEP